MTRNNTPIKTITRKPSHITRSDIVVGAIFLLKDRDVCKIRDVSRRGNSTMCEFSKIDYNLYPSFSLPLGEFIAHLNEEGAKRIA